MKGRKPSAAAARRGTANERKPTAIAPLEYSGAIAAPHAALVPLPRQLPRTKAVKALWCTILQEVARHELRDGDLPLIEALCVAKVRHAQAGAYVKKFGLIIERPAVFDEDGNCIQEAVGPVKNPLLKEERDQAMLYDRLAQRLGLSPESRIRLNLMQIAGATLLGSLRRSMNEAVDAELDGIIEAEAIDIVE